MLGLIKEKLAQTRPFWGNTYRNTQELSIEEIDADLPVIVSVKKPNWREKRYKVSINAFGMRKFVIHVPANKAEEISYDFDKVANATFQDAIDRGPIFVGDTVAIWYPDDTSYIPPINARAKLLDTNVPENVDPKIWDRFQANNSYYPLVSAWQKIGLTPKHDDGFLVCFRSAHNLLGQEDVRGNWQTKIKDGVTQPYVEVLGYD